MGMHEIQAPTESPTLSTRETIVYPARQVTTSIYTYAKKNIAELRNAYTDLGFYMLVLERKAPVLHRR